MACENDNVNKIVEVLDAKKAEDITVLNVSSITTLADYFIIATGNNERQTKAICDNLEEEMAKDGIFPVNKEGYNSGEWVLIGFDEAVVHIFQPKVREFYDLERIWQDAIKINVSDLIK